MNTFSAIFASIFLVVFLLNSKFSKSQFGLILLIFATAVLLVDTIIVKERMFSSMLFVVLGVVKIFDQSLKLKKSHGK